MFTLWRLMNNILYTLEKSYIAIGVVTLYLTGSFAIMHYELVWHKRDLLFWKQFFNVTYHELRHYAVIFVLVAVVVKIFMLLYVIMTNNNDDYLNSEYTQVQVKKRYTELLFKRLLVRLEEIEQRRNFKRYDELQLAELIEARNEMMLEIELFRNDALKLLMPNQNEVCLPIEQIYSLSQKDEDLIKHSKFANLQIDVDNSVLQYFVNPDVPRTVYFN